MPEEITRKKMKGTLRDTFIVLFILISCVPILVLGSISLLGITHTHKNNVSELESQALLSAEVLTSNFFTEITETLSTNFDTLTEEALTHEQSTSSWQEVYAKKFAEDNKAIKEVSFINLQGKEIAKYSKISNTSKLVHISEMALFKKAMRGEIAISTVHTTAEGQAITIFAPSKVNGTVFNVVAAEISLSPLITSIEQFKLGNTGRVFIFDAQGSQIGSKNSNSTDKQYVLSSWKRLSDVLAGTTFDGLSTHDRYESPILSTEVVGSAKKMDNLPFALVVEWPLVESDALIDNFRNSTLIIIFISIILVIIVASFFSNILIKPIKLLESAANKIKEGDFASEVTIETNNELEELAESFNAMSAGLKRLEELKNEFVYVAAHELRAPVTAIKGYLELVFDGDAGTLTPELEHLLTPVKRSNERLVNLVNDLLKVARSEAGKLEITVSPSDIQSEVSAILDEIRPLALKRNMTVTYIQLENLPKVIVNTGSFKEIIMNFASNAVKYGNDNGTIIVSHDIKDGFVSTSIADNGRGMSEEDQKHLFEKFFRAGDVKKTTIEGTGLGLFITKELVEKMGGTLTVTSKLGIGTTFTVTFKQADAIKEQGI